MIAHSRMLPTD